MKLSIIVPVYNMEAYLEKCLDSLVGQTLSCEDFEILAVNDGSTDNSQQIIDRYAQKHPNVKALQKPNGGLSDARNFGILQACGDYLAFVDSDDSVDTDMYRQMLQKAEEKNFDMVVCDFYEVYSDHQERGYSQLSKDILDSNGVQDIMWNIYPSAWNKIYKKELFCSIEYKKGVWFEDVECLYRLLPQVNSIGVVHQPLYYYLQREGSISKSADSRIFHYISNWNGVLEYYKDNGLFDRYRTELEYCYVRYLYATFIAAACKYSRESFGEAVDQAIQNVKEHFPSYRKNKYFYKSLKGVYLVLFNRFLAGLVYRVKHK